MATKTVSIREVFDTNPFTPYQMWVSFLCFCVTFFDGFALTQMAVTMPKIAEYLKTTTAALGVAVGAGMAGPLIGAIVLGMFSDRWGRKRMLVICSLIFGIFSLLIVWVTDVTQLAVLRFISGVGLGGAIPNALAFGCEYAPSRLRATLTTFMWAGMPVGSAINGIAAAWLLPIYGWQSIFIIGGVAPIIIAFLIAMFMPDSVEFMVQHGIDQARIRRVISRIAPALAADKEVQFVLSEQKLPGVPVKHLFMEGRAATTLLLWGCMFFSFYLIWIILSWAPTLLRQSGATVQQYSISFFFINVGSAISTIMIGRLMDKYNKFGILVTAHILAYVGFIIFGLFAGSPFTIIAIVSVISGFFIFASNSGVMALGTITYPVSIRASGLGWAYAVGKVGSMIAPMVGGWCIAQKWSVSLICNVNGTAALVIVVLVIVLWKHLNAASARAAQAAGGS